MIDATNVVAEFKQVDLQAFVNEFAFGDLLYRNYFPSQFTNDLTFQALSGDDQAKVMADLVAFDSRAPRKGRQFVSKYTGDIPKIEISRSLVESDILKYRLLRNAVNSANPVAAQQAKLRLVNFIFDDSTFCLNGIFSKLEWLAKQACSTGQFTLDFSNNADGVKTQVAVKFGIPSANIANSTTDWYGNAATATPITDIKTITDAAAAKAINLRYMFMEKATFNKIVLTAEAQKYFASLVSQALAFQPIPTLAQINQVLTEQQLPTIVLWESNMAHEDKAGNRVNTNGWQAGNVLFSPSLNLGSVQWTTTADGEIQGDPSQKAQNDVALIKRYAIQDPIEVITKGVTYAIPVLDRANQLYISKTKQS